MPVAPTAMPPFRAEVIGSLLRPRRLKDAGRAMQEGRLPAVDYRAILEEEIARVIARQEDMGLRVVTDGELARSSWFGFFFEGLEGFRLEPSRFKFRDVDGATFDWPTCVACAHINRRGPITLGEFARANAKVRRALVKATMPAPSAFHFFRLGGSVEARAYPDVSGFFDDLISVYRSELGELARAGCRYVQFDEVPIAMLCDPEVSRQAQGQGSDLATLIDTYISLLQRIGADPPLPMRLGLHLCRGNFRGRWMAAGGYEPVAEKLFNEAPVDTFLLEYDSARRRLPATALPAQAQDSRAWPRFLQERVPGKPGHLAAAHRRGRPRRCHRSARVVEPMRLCQCGRRQRPDGGGAVAEAAIGGRHGATRLGPPVARSQGRVAPGMPASAWDPPRRALAEPRRLL